MINNRLIAITGMLIIGLLLHNCTCDCFWEKDEYMKVKIFAREFGYSDSLNHLNLDSNKTILINSRRRDTIYINAFEADEKRGIITFGLTMSIGLDTVKIINKKLNLRKVFYDFNIRREKSRSWISNCDCGHLVGKTVYCEGKELDAISFVEIHP